jgi:hypothetical protein
MRLAQLKGYVIDAMKTVSKAQTMEQMDAGEGFVRPFLGDSAGGQLAGAALNVGTAGYSHYITSKAKTEIKQTKALEQQVCYALKTQFNELSGWVTRGKKHDRLGTHNAIFVTGNWLDTINDLLCGGAFFDATSWYLVHRLGQCKDGLRELQANIESLERNLSNPTSMGYGNAPGFNQPSTYPTSPQAHNNYGQQTGYGQTNYGQPTGYGQGGTSSPGYPSAYTPPPPMAPGYTNTY